MSVIRTRIAGYMVEVTPATAEQLESWASTALSMGWHIPEDMSRATSGRFVSPTGDVMDLPYELRSTVMRVNGSCLDILAYHVDELVERTYDTDARHCFDSRPCYCESCWIATNLFYRLNGKDGRRATVVDTSGRHV